MLFRVSSLGGGIVLLAVVLERGMFCKQFRCSIIIDGKTFEAVIDVRKSRGFNILICIVYRISSLCYVLMLKLWVKLSKTFCADKGVFKPGY